MNIQKVENFGLFRGVSYENLIVTPWKGLERVNLIILQNIEKYYVKMSLVFPQNSNNCQNHGLFEGAVMGRHVYPTR